MTQAKMVLSKEEIVSKFNEQVNMTVEELEAWLDNPESKKAGTGVGLESGRKIVEILKKNPEKIPEEYDEVSSEEIVRSSEPIENFPVVIDTRTTLNI